AWPGRRRRSGLGAIRGRSGRRLRGLGSLTGVGPGLEAGPAGDGAGLLRRPAAQDKSVGVSRLVAPADSRFFPLATEGNGPELARKAKVEPAVHRVGLTPRAVALSGHRRDLCRSDSRPRRVSQAV